MQSDLEGHDRRPFLYTRAGRAGFLAIAAYFLITEHAAHVALAIPYLPYLLVLACPLIHVFMHHGGHHHHDNGGAGRPIDGADR